MNEWDKQVSARLDDLWNKHHSGELKAGDVDDVFANALKTLQKAMEGEAEKSGLTTEDDIIALCREVRAEVELARATA